jgi:hypothetical protein
LRLAASDDEVIPLLRDWRTPPAAAAPLRCVPGVLAMFAVEMSRDARTELVGGMGRILREGRRGAWVEAAAWTLDVLSCVSPGAVARVLTAHDNMLGAISGALESASEAVAAAGGGGGGGGAAAGGGAGPVGDAGPAHGGDGGEPAAACSRRTAAHLTKSLARISSVVSLGAAGPVAPPRPTHIALLQSLVTATRQLSLGACCHGWLGAAWAAEALSSPKLLPALVARANAPAEASSPSPLRPWCELARDAPGILRRCRAVLADHARRRRRRWELRGDGSGGGGVGGDAGGAGAACEALSE